MTQKAAPSGGGQAPGDGALGVEGEAAEGTGGAVGAANPDDRPAAAAAPAQSGQAPPAAPQGDPCGGYAESELDEYIDVIEHRFVLPPPDARPAVIQLIERRRVTALVAGNYDQAGVQEKLRESYRISLQLEDEQLNEDHRVDALFQRWQLLKQQEQEITERWDMKIDSLIAEERQKLDDMNARHQKEQKDFAEHWKDPATLRAFTKASARLLQLREQERAMAISRMYAQAKEMKAFADKVQRDETAAAELRIEERMSATRRAMLKQQDFERATFETHRTSVVNTYLFEKNEELRPIVTAIAQIRLKRANSLSGQTSALATERGAVGSQTPRTQQRYAAFKAEKKVAKLRVCSVDDQRKSRSGTQRAANRADEQQQSPPDAAAEQQPTQEQAPKPDEPQPVLSDAVRGSSDPIVAEPVQDQLGSAIGHELQPPRDGDADVSGN
jgi:hypothetical protein